MIFSILVLINYNYNTPDCINMVASLNDINSTKIEKKTYQCPKCKSKLEFRVRRSFFVKNFLFWLRLKRYSCNQCKRKVYVWV